jgi:hypothetical protein
MTEGPWFRVRATVRLAVDLHPQGDTPAPVDHHRPAADHARAAIARIDRGDTALRDLARAFLESIEALEAEVARLRALHALAEDGVALDPEEVEIGGDGMALTRRLPTLPGARVRVWLELPLEGQGERLVALDAEVLASVSGTALRFVDVRPEAVDRVIAFAFQQQAQERRRARETAR